MHRTFVGGVSADPSSLRFFRTTRRPWRAITPLLATVLAWAPLAAQAQVVNINETFTGATAPGWTLLANPNASGSLPAYLTAGTHPANATAPQDPVGQGWLRLTDAKITQAASALYDTAFSSANGIDVKFSYAAYGGNGADGITFYLIDGATANPTAGSRGGSLGYSWSKDYGDPGVTSGFVGIGFDEYGNFSAGTFGDCNSGVPCSRLPNSVTVRGSGSLFGSGASSATATGFSLLATQALTSGIATGSRAGAKSVRITLTPRPDITLTVEIDGTVILTRTLMTNGVPIAGMQAFPATFKLGFSGSTGGASNVHELRNLSVTNLQPAVDARDDAYTATSGQTLSVAASAADRLAANDQNLPTGALFTLVTPPPAGEGTVNVAADGGFGFMPAAGFSGVTRFRYRVCDPNNAARCAEAVAVVTVQPPVTTPPVQPVPALGLWGLLGLGTLLGAFGVRRQRRR